MLSRLAKTAAAMEALQPEVQLNPANCANLKGHWVGKCVSRKDSRDTYKEEERIDQIGCSTFEFDGRPLGVGGILSLHSSGRKSSSAYEATIAWNAPQSRLTFTFAGTIGDFHFLGGKHYEMEGSDVLLVTDTDYFAVMRTDGSTADTTDVKRYDCRYTRQP